VLGFGGPQAERLAPGGDVGGVLQAAGLLFFAFAGYARIATLGEEVRDPARTIPRAIVAALGIVLGVIGHGKGERLGKWAAIASAVALVVGLVAGLAFFNTDMMPDQS